MRFGPSFKPSPGRAVIVETSGCRKRSLLVLLLLVIGCVVVPSSLRGQVRARTPQVTAEVIPAVRSVQPGTPLRVAIRLSVAPGWHTYWKNPGESGLPTTVRWTGPAGFRAGPIQWPYPERKELAGVVVHAYEGEVILLGELYPPPDLSGRDADLAARIRWGVCREVCIPQEVQLSFSLPIMDRAPRPNPRWGRVVAAAARIPRSAAGWTLRAQREEDGLFLRVTPPEGVKLPGGPLTFFPEDPLVLSAAISAVPEFARGGLLLRIDGAKPGSETAPLLRGVLVAPSGWDAAGRFRALQVNVPIEGAGR